MDEITKEEGSSIFKPNHERMSPSSRILQAFKDGWQIPYSSFPSLYMLNAMLLELPPEALQHEEVAIYFKNIFDSQLTDEQCRDLQPFFASVPSASNLFSLQLQDEQGKNLMRVLFDRAMSYVPCHILGFSMNKPADTYYDEEYKTTLTFLQRKENRDKLQKELHEIIQALGSMQDKITQYWKGLTVMGKVHLEHKELNPDDLKIVQTKYHQIATVPRELRVIGQIEHGIRVALAKQLNIPENSPHHLWRIQK